MEISKISRREERVERETPRCMHSKYRVKCLGEHELIKRREDQGSTMRLSNRIVYTTKFLVVAIEGKKKKKKESNV